MNCVQRTNQTRNEKRLGFRGLAHQEDRTLFVECLLCWLAYCSRMNPNSTVRNFGYSSDTTFSYMRRYNFGHCSSASTIATQWSRKRHRDWSEGPCFKLKFIWRSLHTHFTRPITMFHQNWRGCDDVQFCSQDINDHTHGLVHMELAGSDKPTKWM